MSENTQDQAGDLLSEPRGPHYVFAHRALAQISQENPSQFFALMGSEEQQPFLAWLWRKVEQQIGEAAEGYGPEDLKVTTAKLVETFLVLIEMSAPRAIGEAYMVGIALTRVPASSEDPGEARYFTLERGTSLEGTPCTVLCEWADSAHHNYGVGPEPVPALFGQAIAHKLG